MKNKRIIAISAAVSVLIALAWPFFNRPTDQELITQAIESAAEASSDGKPGGVLEYLSRSFEINGAAPGSRGEIADYISQVQPDFTIDKTDADIDGDNAKVITKVEVAIMGGMGGRINIDPINIHLRRETGWTFIFPTDKWRIVSIEAPSFDPKQFAYGL
jgi:hypothetical protein